MTLYSRKQGGIVSAAAEIIMLVCIVLLTGWYLTQNNWVRELLIQSESKTEVKVSNYRELRAAFSNPKIQTIQITQDILMEQDTWGQLLISRDLLLSGGGFVFDAQSMDRHLLVLPGARLTVRNLHFKNGLLSNDVQAQGGAVFVSDGSEAYFEYCSFEGNQAYSLTPNGKAEGGAVFGGTHLKSSFVRNQAVGGTAQGGAVSRGEYRECRFEENQARTSTAKAPAFGGAANEGNFTDCLFLNNKSIAVGQSSGGAGNLGKYLNCLFRENLSQSLEGAAFGGALSNAEGLNSTFLENQAIGSPKGEAYGGALWKGTYINCTLTLNRAFLSPKTEKNTDTANGDTAKLGPASVYGGGSYSGSFTNCIITGNSISGDEIIGRDAFDASSSGGNVIGDAVNSRFELGLNDFIGAQAADVFGSNTPAKNGGIWETLAIVQGSPAEKRGVNAPGVPTKDARGIRRSPLISDSGAYELSGQLLLTEAEEVQRSTPLSPSSRNTQSEGTPQELNFGEDVFEWIVGQPIQDINLGDPAKMVSVPAKEEQARSADASGLRFLKKLMQRTNKTEPIKSQRLHWHVEGLPVGLKFDETLGKISGTPSQTARGELQLNIMRDDEIIATGIQRYQILD